MITSSADPLGLRQIESKTSSPVLNRLRFAGLSLVILMIAEIAEIGVSQHFLTRSLLGVKGEARGAAYDRSPKFTHTNCADGGCGGVVRTNRLFESIFGL